ncbi:hypothetical protein OSB04_019158 [Centaurea solstitialis]|uniref:PPM-type phosphatase domain-containing protein n=1 Tax=Centaurea solstitialis TaxID=347529 RepID=A0AA38SPS0_9ASTR|nr:hypothetical protein OSB04_019158 [Centaurea solstitialis]
MMVVVADLKMMMKMIDGDGVTVVMVVAVADLKMIGGGGVTMVVVDVDLKMTGSGGDGDGGGVTVVFDGQGGVDTTSFTKPNILESIVQDSNFPNGVKKTIKNAFANADHTLADTSSLDNSSGTTDLTVLIFGRRNSVIAGCSISYDILKTQQDTSDPEQHQLQDSSH